MIQQMATAMNLWQACLTAAAEKRQLTECLEAGTCTVFAVQDEVLLGQEGFGNSTYICFICTVIGKQDCSSAEVLSLCIAAHMHKPMHMDLCTALSA